MGAGIAKSIAEKYPEAYQADRKFKMGLAAIEKLGDYSMAQGKDQRIIVNLYGQYKYGRGLQTDYAALERALNGALAWVKKNVNNPVIGLPKYMGCGLAGGSWDIVLDIINRAAAFNQVTINLYELGEAV